MHGEFIGKIYLMDGRETTGPSLKRLTLTRKLKMLYTIAIILVILWLLGMVTSFAAGGLIHILLVIAVVVVLIRVISGRTVL